MNKESVERVIADTIEVFNKTVIQAEKFQQLPKVSAEQYSRLHKDFLTPLDITIDPVLFNQEIEQYNSNFEQWGSTHTQLPRYGLALVNQSGELINNDPINGSLYEYNKNNSNDPLYETDCTTPTPVMHNVKSLEPLNIFNGYWARSNVLKWLDTAKFLPHIDTLVPSPWLRLWATTDPDTVTVRYYSDGVKTCTDIEAGRIYLIDTSLVHEAVSTGTNYQLFLSVNPYAVDIIEEHLK